jgi:hypothetical protein
MQNLVVGCGASDFLDHKKKILKDGLGLGFLTILYYPGAFLAQT